MLPCPTGELGAALDLPFTVVVVVVFAVLGRPLRAALLAARGEAEASRRCVSVEGVSSPVVNPSSLACRRVSIAFFFFSSGEKERGDATPKSAHAGLVIRTIITPDDKNDVQEKKKKQANRRRERKKKDELLLLFLLPRHIIKEGKHVKRSDTKKKRRTYELSNWFNVSGPFPLSLCSAPPNTYSNNNSACVCVCVGRCSRFVCFEENNSKNRVMVHDKKKGG